MTDQGLGFAVEILPDEHGAYCIAQNVVGVSNARPPRLFVTFGAHQRFAKDLPRFPERFGQTRQVRPYCVPSQVIMNRSKITIRNKTNTTM